MIYVHCHEHYQGNGGFIFLMALVEQLAAMGYDVALFNERDSLDRNGMAWACAPIPRIAGYQDVINGEGPIVSTWLHSWLDDLQQRPELWPRLRYWCSSELLRQDMDASRDFVREHCRQIAICNPTLAPHYETLGFIPRWKWPMWIRSIFEQNSSVRQSGVIGFQPEHIPNSISDDLRARYGAENVHLCTGTQREVARAMQQCDLFVQWNGYKSLLPGRGETFGLSMYEALACGCVTLARKHIGNSMVHGIVPRCETRDELFMYIDRYLADDKKKARARLRQASMLNDQYRFDEKRAAAIRGYIEHEAR